MPGPGDFTETSGYQAVAALLRVAPRPDAVFAGNDYMAIGVVSGLSEAGLQVPDDMAVSGFDDIAMACHANPPLTTISPPKPAMGRLAVDLILRGADSRPPAVSSFIMLESPLIVRESTARVLE